MEAVPELGRKSPTCKKNKQLVILKIVKRGLQKSEDRLDGSSAVERKRESHTWVLIDRGGQMNVAGAQDCLYLETQTVLGRLTCC